MADNPHKVPCVVCEVCGFLWGALMIGGTTYLVVAEGWTLWSYVGGVLLTAMWSCRLACTGKAPRFKEDA